MSEQEVTDPNLEGDGQSGREAEPQTKVRRGPRWLRDRRMAALVGGAVALAVLAVFLGGAALGWTASASVVAGRDLVAPEPSSSASSQVVAVADAAGVLTPDVRGLSEDDARQVLADAGIATGVVSTTTREAAGPPGQVIAQSPVFGTADPAAVELVISTTAKVPQVAGKDGQQVAAALAALGAEVTLKRAYVAGTRAGTGISIEPAPGQDLPGQVTLVIADGATSVFLSDLDTVTGGCSSDEVSVNGVPYENALVCSAQQEPRETAWVVGRAVDVFDAILGVPDDGDPGAAVRVEVLADGVPKADVTVAYGTSTPVHVPVTGALRLTVRVTNVSADNDVRAVAVLGGASVSGGTEAVTAWNTPAP